MNYQDMETEELQDEVIALEENLFIYGGTYTQDNVELLKAYTNALERENNLFRDFINEKVSLHFYSWLADRDET